MEEEKVVQGFFFSTGHQPKPLKGTGLSKAAITPVSSIPAS